MSNIKKHSKKLKSQLNSESITYTISFVGEEIETGITGVFIKEVFASSLLDAIIIIKESYINIDIQW